MKVQPQFADTTETLPTQAPLTSADAALPLPFRSSSGKGTRS